MSTPRLSQACRLASALVFVTCLGAYSYFYQAGGWNQNSRFNLVRSLVEQRTAVIDAYYRNTGDLSCRGPQGRCTKPDPTRGKHAYSDKAPGASWLAAPAYVPIYLAAGTPKPTPRYLAAASYACTVWAVSLPAALAAGMLVGLFFTLGLSARTAAALALAYGLATLAFPYATLFYGHQLMAALLVIAWVMLVRIRHNTMLPSAGRLALIGAIAGFAVAVEYPAALAILPMCVYAALCIRPWPRLVWLIAGMAAPALALAAYHAMVFGSPMALPYDFSTQPHRGQGFFMGLGVPRIDALGHILFSSYRGLFYSAPWLLLAVPGGILLWRRGARAEAAVCAVIFALFVWLNASLVDWQGGWAMGPRYLIPAIPFAAIAAAGLGLIQPLRARVLALAALGIGALYAAFLMLVGIAVKPEVPVVIRRPFGEFLFDHFFRGELAVNTQSINSIGPAPGTRHAWNLGELMGLSGLMSLVPLAVFILVLIAALWRVTASRTETPGQGM